MGAGPLSVPSGNLPALQANGLAQVREAVKILQEGLSSLPIGSKPHQAVAAAISSLGRIASPSDEIPGHDKTVLQNLQRNAGKNRAGGKYRNQLGAPPMPGGEAAPSPAG